MTTPSNQDLIAAAVNQEPVAFRATFDALMAPRILDTINKLHADVAADMFAITQQKDGE
jgi:hypothetical protein